MSKNTENEKESAGTGTEQRIIMCFDDFFKLYNVTEKDKQELLYRLYKNDKQTLLSAGGDSMHDIIPFLSPAELERLALLSEELGEVQQAIGKILRHGYNSCHPETGISNRRDLERELGDLQYAIHLLKYHEDVHLGLIEQHEKNKSKKIGEYLHHQ